MREFSNFFYISSLVGFFLFEKWAPHFKVDIQFGEVSGFPKSFVFIIIVLGEIKTSLSNRDRCSKNWQRVEKWK